MEKDFAEGTLIILVGISLFSTYLFGITGLRVFLGIVLVSLPFYLIFGNFHFDEGEKIVFSVLLGLVLFSAFVYLLGFAISFRLSIAAVFLALVGIAFIIKRIKK